jgi:hypothetical protein
LYLCYVKARHSTAASHRIASNQQCSRVSRDDLPNPERVNEDLTEKKNCVGIIDEQQHRIQKFLFQTTFMPYTFVTHQQKPKQTHDMI